MNKIMCNRFHNVLPNLLISRLQWLSKRSEVIASNIANADVKSAKRKELCSFKDFIKKQSSSSMSWSPNRNIITTDEEISREFETLDMSNNTNEHEGVVSVLKAYQKMIRSAINKQS